MYNKCIAIIIVVAVIVGGGAFYGGMKYAQNKTPQNQGGQLRNGMNFGNAGSSPGQRGLAGGQRGQGGPNGGGGFSGGQITAKDDTSITIKTRNGSSQIVFYSPSTTVDKSVAGSVADLSIGQQVSANGTANPDGSLAASNIAIRPADANGAQGVPATPATPGN